MTNDDNLKERLATLASYVEVFERPGFVFGEPRGLEEIAPGQLTMPWVALSEPAGAFVEAAYDAGWVMKDFDWTAWKQTAEAALLLDPDVIATASCIQLAKLLTTLIRGDRFAEGTLSGAYDRGILTAIVRRAEVLLVSRDS